MPVRILVRGVEDGSFEERVGQVRRHVARIVVGTLEHFDPLPVHYFHRQVYTVAAYTFLMWRSATSAAAPPPNGSGVHSSRRTPQYQRSREETGDWKSPLLQTTRKSPVPMGGKKAACTPPVEPDLRRPQRDHVLNRLPVQVRLLSHGERLLEMKTLHTIRHNTEDTHQSCLLSDL